MGGRYLNMRAGGRATPAPLTDLVSDRPPPTRLRFARSGRQQRDDVSVVYADIEVWQDARVSQTNGAHSFGVLVTNRPPVVAESTTMMR